MSRDQVIAILLVEVEYRELPDESDIKSAIEELSGYGIVRKAELRIVKDTVKDLR